MQHPIAAGAFGLRPLRDHRGFTVLELVVVVLIMSILIAIAIPTYLGAVRSAQDRVAQSDLRSALAAARVVAVDDPGGAGSFASVDETVLQAAEPSLDFGLIAAASEDVIGVLVAAGGTRITLELQGRSDRWFAVSADDRGAISYCSALAAGGCDDGGTDVFIDTPW